MSLCACALFVTLAGCSSGKKEVSDVYDSNIKKLYVAYQIFLSRHGGVGPKNEAEFKKFMVDNPTGKFLIERTGVDTTQIDDYFLSERDGEPFVINYGLKGTADHAAIFEATGVDGKRYVAFGIPVELESAEYEDYLSGKLKGATPNESYGE